jgi:tripartite-type tricarboxylate transporter receptor subunit TctC
MARAQAYPTRPVRIVVGFAAGGGTDLTARLIAQWLSERIGQPFIVENRPGASSNVAAEMVARALPDGHTLLFANATNAINATLYDNLSFNFVRDMVPVASIMRVPLVMEVHPSVPTMTPAEFIAYAKANPGKLNVASPGIGTPLHVAGEMFKMMSGLDIVFVTYRGTGPALVDLLAGQTQVMFDALPASLEHIKAGRLRALAVTTAVRAEALPNVPPLGDVVPGYEASSWFGLVAPTGTPDEAIDRLNKEVNSALNDAKFKSRFTDLGGTVLIGSPSDFGKLIADETGKWGKVVKFSGIKPH